MSFLYFAGYVHNRRLLPVRRPRIACARKTGERRSGALMSFTCNPQKALFNSAIYFDSLRNICQSAQTLSASSAGQELCYLRIWNCSSCAPLCFKGSQYLTLGAFVRVSLLTFIRWLHISNALVQIGRQEALSTRGIYLTLQRNTGYS